MKGRLVRRSRDGVSVIKEWQLDDADAYSIDDRIDNFDIFTVGELLQASGVDLDGLSTTGGTEEPPVSLRYDGFSLIMYTLLIPTVLI
jgi:hypothetical protein